MNNSAIKTCRWRCFVYWNQRRLFLWTVYKDASGISAFVIAVNVWKTIIMWHKLCYVLYLLLLHLQRHWGQKGLDCREKRHQSQSFENDCLQVVFTAVVQLEKCLCLHNNKWHRINRLVFITFVFNHKTILPFGAIWFQILLCGSGFEYKNSTPYVWQTLKNRGVGSLKCIHFKGPETGLQW